MKFAAMFAIVATAAATTAASDVQPVVDLLHRVLPSHADLFSLQLAPARFELPSTQPAHLLHREFTESSPAVHKDFAGSSPAAHR